VEEVMPMARSQATPEVRNIKSWMVGILGEKSSYGVGLGATIAFLPAAVMFLISSSFVIANHSPTTFTVTALLAGIFIIVRRPCLPLARGLLSPHPFPACGIARLVDP
jgi:hypothetical protein